MITCPAECDMRVRALDIDSGDVKFSDVHCSLEDQCKAVKVFKRVMYIGFKYIYMKHYANGLPCPHFPFNLGSSNTAGVKFLLLKLSQL